jgi:hypothetical protein
MGGNVLETCEKNATAVVTDVMKTGTALRVSTSTRSDRLSVNSGLSW